MKNLIKKTFSILLALVLCVGINQTEADASSTISKTVTTQNQLNSALVNTKVSKIMIKSTSGGNFTIPKGEYHKDLVVYQSNINLLNNGSFDNLNIIVKNQKELTKALSTYDVEVVTLKSTSKSNIVLNGKNPDINLIVDAYKLGVTNNGQWKSITIKNNASWVENAQNNDFILTASKFNITSSESAAIRSVYINRSSSTLNINANSTIESVIAKRNATIILSGNFEGQVLNSIEIENIKGKVKATTSNSTYSIEAYNSPVQIEPIINKTHVHDEGTWIEQEATTTRIGAKVRYCTECREVLEVITIPMLLEDTIETNVPSHNHEYILISDIPATCTTIGIKTYRCIDNDNKYVETTPATKHDEGIWYEQKATTTRNGLRVRACTKCGAILESETIPKLVELIHEHTYTCAVTTPATCTNEGVKEYICTSGDDTYTESIPKLSHSLGEWEIVTEPTTSLTGLKVRKCTICCETIEEEIIHQLEDKEVVDGHELVTVTIDIGYGQTKEVRGYYDYDKALEVYSRLNELRTSKGLNPLIWNSGMAPSADVRAAELTVKFDHWRPNGEYCYDIYSTMTSENVAMGYLSAPDVMVGWINSASHYNAMVKADYKSVSISCFMYEGLPGQYIGYWSMLFSKY